MAATSVAATYTFGPGSGLADSAWSKTVLASAYEALANTVLLEVVCCRRRGEGGSGGGSAEERPAALSALRANDLRSSRDAAGVKITGTDQGDR